MTWHDAYHSPYTMYTQCLFRLFSSLFFFSTYIVFRCACTMFVTRGPISCTRNDWLQWRSFGWCTRVHAAVSAISASRFMNRWVVEHIAIFSKYIHCIITATRIGSSKSSSNRKTDAQTWLRQYSDSDRCDIIDFVFIHCQFVNKTKYCFCGGTNIKCNIGETGANGLTQFWPT